MSTIHETASIGQGASSTRKRKLKQSFEQFSESLEKFSQVWYERGLGNPGMCVLEQKVIRSHNYEECIDCGEDGAERVASHLIKVVPHYWFCAECANYWLWEKTDERECWPADVAAH